jgi:hypothetical protein
MDAAASPTKTPTSRASQITEAQGDETLAAHVRVRRIVDGTGPEGLEKQEKGETHMKKAQVIGIVTGVTVGLLGVAVGVALAREEGRQAARKWLAQSGDLAQKGQQRAVALGQQARKTAVEQAPKVQERLNTIISSTAPQAADALNAALARTGLNGRVETTQP